MTENSEIQDAFSTIVNTDFRVLPPDPLVKLALGIWYENFVPDIGSLNSHISFARAGYVLERLLAFHCVTSDVRRQIQPVIEKLEKLLEPNFTIVPKSTVVKMRDYRGDPLAQRWGLRDSLSSQVQSILPFQTRHYNHEKAANMNLNRFPNETLNRAIGVLNSWGCSFNQQCSILGMSDESILDSHKSIPTNLKLSSQQSERVIFINSIDEAIRAQFNNPENVRGFMSMVNKNSPFNGRSPLSLIEDGNIEQLREVAQRMWLQIYSG